MICEHEMEKQAEEIKTLVDLRAEAPNQLCREHAQSLINERKLNIIEYAENLLKEIRERRSGD